jgi:Cof subfamily protein (haloacid dehalogenase superfamily)
MRRNKIKIKLPNFRLPPDAISIDLDGTLLNSQSILSERNRKALEKCLALGIPIIIATSRPIRSVRRLIGSELTNRCSLVLQNGALGIGAPPLTGRIKEKIKPVLPREIVTVALKMEPEIRITIELEGYWFGTNQPREPNELWEINSATPDMQRPLEEALADEPTKIALGGLKYDISHVAEALQQRFGNDISVVPSNELTFLNITSQTATKPDTLRKILQSKQIALTNVMAFGDDVPDVELLSVCGMPIAVANAVSEVKAVCDYCTASNDDDGVAIVLERIIQQLYFL